MAKAKKGIDALEAEIAELEKQAMGQAEPEPQKQKKEEKPVEPPREVEVEDKSQSEDLIERPKQPEVQEEGSTDFIERPKATKEEETFKKRYSDLRRHAQEKENKLNAELERLRKELEARPTAAPTNAAEIKKWAETNPEAAAIVREIAKEHISQEALELETKISELRATNQKAERERQMAIILKAHPDFSDVVKTSEFHTWAENQPKRISDMVYGNAASDVVWALDLYKRTNAKDTKDDGAADAVTTRSTKSEPKTKDKPRYTESQIRKMSVREFEEKEEDINKAAKEGRILYDLSAPA